MGGSDTSLRAGIGRVACKKLVVVPQLLVVLLSWPVPVSAGPPYPAHVERMSEEAADALYRQIGLDGMLQRAVFVAGLGSMKRHGLKASILAIADMSQPSNVLGLVKFLFPNSFKIYIHDTPAMAEAARQRAEGGPPLAHPRASRNPHW